MVIKLILLIIVMICGLCAVYCGIKVLRISNYKGINQFRNKDKDIEEIANSFKSYDKMYDDLLEFGVGSLSHPIELEWMMEYFTKNEDYEKCSILIDFKNQINKK